MWLVAVRKTIMPLGRNLSFVFSPILMKQFLTLPHKAYRASAGNEKNDFGVVGTYVSWLLFRSKTSSL